MVNHQKIDALFRDRLSNHEVSPPLRNWKIIQGGLPKPKPFYQNPIFLVGVTAVALIMGGLIGYWSSEQTHRTQAFHQQSTTTPDRYDSHSTEGTSTTFSTPQRLVPTTSNPLVPAANTAAGKLSKATDKLNVPQFDPKNAKLLPTSIIGNETLTNATKGNAKGAKKTTPIENAPLSEVQHKGMAGNYGLVALNNKAISSGYNTYSKPPLSSAETIAALKEDATNTANLVLQQQQFSQSSAMTNATIVDHNQKMASVATLPLVAPVVDNSSVATAEKTTIERFHLEKLVLAESSLLVEAQVGKQKIETPLRTNNALLAAIAPIKVPMKNTTGFSVGLLGMANHTWISGKTASDPTIVGELNAQFDMGHNYGVALSYDWTKKWGIATEVLYAQQNQTYSRLIDGQMKSTSLSLTYLQIPLTVRYKHPHYSPLFNRQSSCNVGLGLQYAMLQSAEIPLDNPAIQQGLLKKHHWGLVVDADYDLSMTKHLYLNVGMRGTISRGSNSFAVPWLNSTNTILLGLKGGIYYKF